MAFRSALAFSYTVIVITIQFFKLIIKLLISTMHGTFHTMSISASINSTIFK